MKNYIKVSITILLFSGLFFSCTPNKVTDGDINSELSEEQANDERIKKREGPSTDD